MQYLGAISKMTDLCLFPRQTIQYYSKPSLCPNQKCWRSWSWMVLWRPSRPSRTNTQKRCPFHHRGLECKSRTSRDTWSNRQIWPWNAKNWCCWTVVLEKTLESPLDCKEIQPVHPKGDQSWIFFGKTDAEAQTPILWPPDDSLEKTLKLGKIEGRRSDGWMASPTQWSGVWASSRSWWWTGKPAMLQSMGLQSRTRLSDWTELKGSRY